MAITVQSLGIDRLPIDEQLALVHAIWDGIVAAGGRPSLTDAQRQELRRRVADDDANPDDVIPWDQVRAEILGRTDP